MRDRLIETLRQAEEQLRLMRAASTSSTEKLDRAIARVVEDRAALSSSSPAPGHTDLMVTPESIDAFLEANPPPAAPAPRPEETRPFCSATLGAFRCEKREGHDGQHFAWADGQTHRWGARPEETPDGR